MARAANPMVFFIYLSVDLFVMSLTRKEKLIDIVELYPDLWKPSKKDPNLKQRLWNLVGAEIGTTGFDARRQWEILRGQYRHEYKRYTNDKTYKSKWMLYDRMNFIKTSLRSSSIFRYEANLESEELPFGEHQVLGGLTEMVEQKYDKQSDVIDLPKIQIRQDLQGRPENSESLVTIFPVVVDEKPSTSVGVSSSSQCAEYSDPYSNSNESRPNRRRRKWHIGSDEEEDEDYHFAMSILPSLRSIPYTRKLRTRSKIMELIATELDASFDDENRIQHAKRLVKMESDIEEKYTPTEGDIE